MRHLNERHTWFNLDNNEDCIMRYETVDGSMLDDDYVTNLNNDVIIHNYGFILFKTSLKKITQNSFISCKQLASLTIPNGVTSLGSSAFEKCENLKSVYIPDSVVEIKSNCFFNSGLEVVTIPKGVKKIEYFAFANCINLRKIDVDKSNDVFDCRDNCNAIIETASNCLIVGCKNTNIPNTVISLETHAFCGATKLTSINIPEGVDKIKSDVFYGCYNLTNITIPRSMKTIYLSAFSGRPKLTLDYNGTHEEFNNIKTFGTRNVDIKCTDGQFVLN